MTIVNSKRFISIIEVYYVWYGMGLGWIVFILLIVYFVYLFNQKNINTKSKKSAQDILDERYAKGEIQEEEYKQKSEELLKHH